MKFGHTLKKAQDMAKQKAQIYNDYWVNYKQLKKQIKNICRAKAAECSASSEGASSEDQAPEGKVAPKIGALRTVHDAPHTCAPHYPAFPCRRRHRMSHTVRRVQVPTNCFETIERDRERLGRAPPSPPP